MQTNPAGRATERGAVTDHGDGDVAGCLEQAAERDLTDWGYPGEMVVEKDLNDAEKASQVVGTKKEPCSAGAISSGLEKEDPELH